jgi:hypothetical protein
VRQYFLDGFYPTGTPLPGDALIPSGALVKSVLLNATVDMNLVAGYPSNAEGWGRLVLDRTLYFPSDARRLIVRDVRNAEGLGTGESQEFDITVTSAAEALRVTLVFTDPPAMVGAAHPVVNDLDLIVIGPNEEITGGGTFRGNYFKNGQSEAGGVADPLNNVEQVYLPAPHAGTYSIEVRGTQVNGAFTQGYAVVVSGAVSEPQPEQPLYGDADEDGDIDLADFARMQSCHGGQGRAYVMPACAAFDVDVDGDVDLTDFAAFGPQFSGPGAAP